MARNRKVSTTDLLAAFADRRDPFEPLTASEVADEVELGRRAVANRLEELANESPPVLRTKKTGAKGRVWWPNADVWYPDVSSVELGGVSIERVLGRVRNPRHGEAEGTADPEVERVLDTLEIPGSGEIAQARRQAIRNLYRHLREEGESTKRELCGLVDADEVGYGDVDSFWNNLIIRKDVMRELPGVVPPGEGGHYYHFVGK